MSSNPFSNITGLSDRQVHLSKKQHGINEIVDHSENKLIWILKTMFLEPMFLILVLASFIYFLLGETGDGFVMLAAIVFVAAISIYQEIRSQNAINSLKELTQAISKVIRNNEIVKIPSKDIVVGDFLLIEEGNLVPADGIIIQSNDFALNESSISGESFSVLKTKDAENNEVYFGTQVVSGYAICEIQHIGSSTLLGKIGKSLESIVDRKTPLQIQINRFVKQMAGLGVIAFILVWTINYIKSNQVLTSLLHGLTLAMSILPEEIPVAFATFMAFGAWRLAKNGVLTKEPRTVESLGSATVICIDKTGTITKNSMQLTKLYSYEEDKVYNLTNEQKPENLKVLAYAMWASEEQPFDPMEKAIHQAYSQFNSVDLRASSKMIHEYPLSGSPPMMTHIYNTQQGSLIIAAKGGWESIIKHCHLPQKKIEKLNRIAIDLGKQGLRILGVASSNFKGNNFPENQEDFIWSFEGLIALEDPPKTNISSVFKRFYNAGIQLKMMTGDYLETAMSIANKTGFIGTEKVLLGSEVMNMDEDSLKQSIKVTNIFVRMFPEAKLKVIEALKKNGEVVAMTGDGVNDAPALKAAHIGVAMGKRGTETAKRASSVILINDDLNKMAEAVLLGRRIYTNFKKATRYIISIHIPIILSVAVPLILGWKYSNIFSPIHIIFFELIMGPTCSLIFENEPIEARLQHEKPRKLSKRLFAKEELFLSITQGLIISIGVLFIYQLVSINYANPSMVRTASFTTIILSNIFLTLVNRSFYHSVFHTIKYKNKLVPFIIIITSIALTVILLNPFFQNIFDIIPISPSLFFTCMSVSFISVMWIEIYKWGKRRESSIKIK